MEDDGEKRHRFKRSSELDWISSLPDCSLCQILTNLPTKDVVKTSVLSTRWRNLWKHVPSLDLANLDFPDLNTLSTFVDSFLDFNRDSTFLHKFNLNYGFRIEGEADPEKKIDVITRWINTVVTTRKLKHLEITDDADGNWELEMPTTLYACESLVSLNLSYVTLPSVKNLVSLSCLKSIYLNDAAFDDRLALEMLISRCPVLESLGIEKTYCAQVLRVRSESLLRFTHFAENIDDELVEVDAPRLEYLRIIDHRVGSFVLKNVASSLVEVDIDNLNYDKRSDPNDVQKKRNVIRGFLVGISRVKVMTIASRTLEVIYDYSRCEPLPLFRNLTFLRVEFYGFMWEMLPVFLESCPNLKSLVVGSSSYRENYGVHTLFQPQRFLSCLEYVKIESPLEGDAAEMKLVSYLLGNSTILKKLTLFVDVSIKAEESAVLKKLLTIPRLSRSCQVVVL